MSNCKKPSTQNDTLAWEDFLEFYNELRTEISKVMREHFEAIETCLSIKINSISDIRTGDILLSHSMNSLMEVTMITDEYVKVRHLISNDSYCEIYYTGKPLIGAYVVWRSDDEQLQITLS